MSLIRSQAAVTRWTGLLTTNASRGQTLLTFHSPSTYLLRAFVPLKLHPVNVLDNKLLLKRGLLACGWNFPHAEQILILEMDKNMEHGLTQGCRGRTIVAASQSSKENKKCDVAPQHVIFFTCYLCPQASPASSLHHSTLIKLIALYKWGKVD